MKRIHIAAIFIVLLFLLGSCKEGIDNLSLDHNTGQVQVHFALNVTSNLREDSYTTRAVEASNTAKDFNDKDIKNLWVLQSQNGDIVTKSYYTNISPSNILSSLKSGNSEIWFIANTGDESLFSNITTLEELKSQVLNVNTAAPENSLAVDNYLRAVGCWKGDVKTDNFISVSLVPLAAKLTINYEIIGAGAGYGFENIQLTNVPVSIHYCTTTSGTSTKNYNTTAYADFVPTADCKQKGRLVYYVTENVPDLNGIVNEDPRKKNQFGKNTKAMNLVFQGKFLFQGKEMPFVVELYPGENTTNDFNVKINHNYHISLSIDASKGPNNWEEDCRITVNNIKLPTDGLQVWYEFSDDKKRNSLYEMDGTTVLPNNGKYLRNLADDTYSSERLVYEDSERKQPEQIYEDGTNYMSYSNCSISSMYGSELTSSLPFTIVYIGGCGKVNSLGWSVYGPTNYGDPNGDPSGKKDGRRWYLVVHNTGVFQYGSQSVLNTTIENFGYIFDENDPYIFFSVDKNTPNEAENTGGTRDILLDNAAAQTLNVGHFEFASNIYLGCNKWEKGWVTQSGRVYLFLIYNKTLSAEEVNQIRAYALYKGFLKHSLPY